MTNSNNTNMGWGFEALENRSMMAADALSALAERAFAEPPMVVQIEMPDAIVNKNIDELGVETEQLGQEGDPIDGTTIGPQEQDIQVKSLDIFLHAEWAFATDHREDQTSKDEVFVPDFGGALGKGDYDQKDFQIELVGGFELHGGGLGRPTSQKIELSADGGIELHSFECV